MFDKLHRMLFKPTHKKTINVHRLQIKFNTSRFQIVSSFKLASVTIQAGLCQTCSETQIVVFLMQRPTFANFQLNHLINLNRQTRQS